MPKTIQFCGDSFCADTDATAWTTILAKKLGAVLIGKGRGGTAYENIFNTFNSNATYSVFCWTDAHRLYVQTENYDINYATALANRKKSLHHAAALAYFKFINHTEYNLKRQFRELFWFDHDTLSKSNTKAIHLFCFKNTYTFAHGFTFQKPIVDMFQHEHQLHDVNKNATYVEDASFVNHLTHQDNKLLAEKVYSKFTDPLLFS